MLCVPLLFQNPLPFVMVKVKMKSSPKDKTSPTQRKEEERVEGKQRKPYHVESFASRSKVLERYDRFERLK